MDRRFLRCVLSTLDSSPRFAKDCLDVAPSGDDFYGVDGVNAVRCEIDEREAIYVTGLALGEGESWGCKRYVDVEKGEFVVSAEIVGISDEGRALLRELSKETK